MAATKKDREVQSSDRPQVVAVRSDWARQFGAANAIWLSQTVFTQTRSPAQFAHARAYVRMQSTRADYARFKAHKSTWSTQPPEATPAEYQAAVRAIAKACRI